MNEQLATELLRKYNSGDCSAAERQLIESWYQELINTGELEWAEGEKESIQNATEEWLLQNITADDFPSSSVRRLDAGSITMWAAAAILVILTGTVFYLYNKRQVATTVAKADVLINDVAPGGNKAVLTLANGTTIVLDDAPIGMVAQQVDAKVLKPGDGQLVYTQEGKNKDAPLSYNTLATPRSGQYQLVLPDGSKVWLNAGSSIRYPVTFMGNERRVQITGEAYFEVAPLSPPAGGESHKIPFVVMIKDKGEVEVLGTHFNINAYDDEGSMKTTLLEGKVKASMVNGEWSILKPGQQAVISRREAADSRLTIHDKTDVEDVVAWKNGLFHFESSEIKTVMRQIARWYDVDVVYERTTVKNDPMFVEISRNTRLSDVLKALEESGSAKFSIQGKTIIVK
jgi:transmembrane sensor